MEMPSAPTLSHRKRVHFSYDEDNETKDEAPRAKKARFPKGKKGAPGGPPARNLGRIDGEEDEGPILLSADARIAAKERALKRDPATETILVEDTGVLEDVTVAEEVYEEEDEEIVEDGVRFEPFNLKQEREEGYFDAQGNYVEYRNENDGKDAWLDSVEVDTRFAAKALAQKAKDADIDEDNLGKEELWAIKRRIADALQPGETVLRALRRLKGTTNTANRRERMSEATKVVFDQLTEDAMKLLDDGDYNVYEEKRETFQREAEGYAALARLRAGTANGQSSLAGGGGDMFGDDEDTEEAGPSNHSSTNVAGGVTQLDGKAQDMFGDDEEDESRDLHGSKSGDAPLNGAAHSDEATTTTVTLAITTMPTRDYTAAHLQVYGINLMKRRTHTQRLHNDEHSREILANGAQGLAIGPGIGVYYDMSVNVHLGVQYDSGPYFGLSKAGFMISVKKPVPTFLILYSWSMHAMELLA